MIMRNAKNLIVVICAFSLLVACSVSHQLTKAAQKSERSGDTKEAAGLYLSALESEPDNVKALLGLKRLGERRIESDLQNFENLVKRNDLKGAYNQYREIEKILARASVVNVVMTTPKENRDQFEKIRDQLSEKHYLKGVSLIDEKKYEAAINELESCIYYNPRYKEVQGNLKKAKDGKNYEAAQRLYLKAKVNLSQKNYRAAYGYLNDCLKVMPSFRDASSLKQEAVRLGNKTVLILGFKNSTRMNNVTRVLHSDISTRLRRQSDPFLTIKSNSIVKRSRSEAISYAKGQGADFVIMGEIRNFQKSGGDLNKEKIEAFYVTKSNNGSVSSRPTSFTLYQGNLSVSLGISYSIVDANSGTKLNDDYNACSYADNIKYAYYSGDPSRLSLTNPVASSSSSEVLKILASVGAALTTPDQSLFTARKRFLNDSELCEKAISSGLSNIVSSIKMAMK